MDSTHSRIIFQLVTQKFVINSCCPCILPALAQDYSHERQIPTADGRLGNFLLQAMVSTPRLNRNLVASPAAAIPLVIASLISVRPIREPQRKRPCLPATLILLTYRSQ